MALPRRREIIDRYDFNQLRVVSDGGGKKFTAISTFSGKFVIHAEMEQSWIDQRGGESARPVASENCSARKIATIRESLARAASWPYFAGWNNSTNPPTSGSRNITARPSLTFTIPPSETVVAPAAFACE